MNRKEWMLYLPLGIFLAVIASTITSAFTSARPVVGAGDPVGGETDAALLGAVRDLARALDGVEARQTELERGLAALASPATSARTEVGGLDAAVARWMETNATTVEAGPEALGTELASTPAGLDAIVDALLTGELSGDEEQALWQRLRDEDKIDEVLAELEQMVEADPNNPEMHVELGNAYVQKIFDVGVGPLAGVWGEKADNAYDAALALDENHWDARFEKAVSLSNWPAFLGKAGEAIHQFETLVEQQEGRTPRPAFAQTYYFLGNMYQQTGETDKAHATWQRGLGMFPDHELLLQQLAENSR